MSKCVRWMGAFLALAGLCGAAPALAGGLLLTLSPVAPMHSGTDYYFGVALQLENFDVPVRHAPFTVRLTLPVGLNYVSSSLGGGWTCTPVAGIEPKFSLSLDDGARHSGPPGRISPCFKNGRGDPYDWIINIFRTYLVPPGCNCDIWLTC